MGGEGSVVGDYDECVCISLEEPLGAYIEKLAPSISDAPDVHLYHRSGVGT